MFTSFVYSWYGVKQTWLDADSHTTEMHADTTNSTYATMDPGKFELPLPSFVWFACGIWVS